MPPLRRWLLLSASLLCTAAYPAPLIIAHRGAPCALPEETLEGFQKAIDDGADFIEMDVVSTKDGYLICRHDIILDDSTNIAELPQFADRRRTDMLPNGMNMTGFFAHDFSLEEIKQLYARQVIPFRDQASRYQYRIPTVDEVLELVARNQKSDRPVGIYIETKAPVYHDMIGLPLEPRLAAAIADSGMANYIASDIILQSFEPLALENLKRELEALGLPVTPLVWLVDCLNAPSEEQLDEFAKYGTHLGLDKGLVVPLYWTEECLRPTDALCYQQFPGQACAGRLPPEYAAALNGSQPPPKVALIESAKRRGLQIHSFTFRNEGRFQALDFLSDPVRELDFFHSLGVDGMFVDCPLTAVTWRSCASDSKTESKRSWGVWVAIAAAVVIALKVSSVVGGFYGWRWWQRRRKRQAEAESGDAEAPSHEMASTEQARDDEPLLASEIRLAEMSGPAREHVVGVS